MGDDAELLRLVRELNGGIAIRTAGAADASAFEALMNEHYRRQKPPGYFAWRFLRSPFPSRLIVAESAGMLVACLGGHVLNLVDGRRVLFTVDLLIRESYRNQGLHWLLELELESFAREHGALALVALPNDAGRAAHESVPGATCVGEIVSLAAPTSALNSTTKRLSPETSRLVAFAHHEPSYRRWRFDMNPEYRYKTWSATDACHLTAKVFQDPMSGGRIGDLVDYGDQLFSSADSLSQATQWFTEKQCPEVQTWALPHTGAHAIFSDMGFRPTLQKRYCCVRPFSPQTEDLTRMENWALMPADSEVY